jgi:hypothetical protein
MAKPAAVGLALALTVATGGCGAGEERADCSLTGEIGTICGFRNPEDLEWVETAGIVLVSNMRFDGPVVDGGYISALLPGQWQPRILWGPGGPAAAAAEPALGAAACKTAPDPEALYTHGLTSKRVGGRTLIYMAAHAGELGGREAVEIFELGGQGENAALIWKACIPTENAIQANDVFVGDDGTVVISNYVPDGSIRHTLRAAILGQATGDVMTWRADTGWKHLDASESLMANGVALSPDGKTLFYAETLGGKLHRRSLAGATGAVDVAIEGAPDNLTWTDRGTLLLASHTAGAGFMLCVLGRSPCRSSWAVYEIDPNTLVVSEVIKHSGDTVGAVATALEIKGTLLLSSVFDDRIGYVTRP